MQLEGKRVIVTGGGQGIGRGIVEAFLDEGARVAVLQRRELASELRDRGAIGIQADLSDAETIPTAVTHAIERLGTVDVLVNNAGIMFERATEEITVLEWDLMMALNLRAPMFLVQAALPHMRERGGGSIINISSIEALGSNPLHAAYSASKAGVHGLTRALAVDLGNDGIRCNAINPGWIDTELSANYLDTASDPVAARDSLLRLHPVGRTGSPADIGTVAVFLASDRSAFITGETLTVDGGRTKKLPLPM